MSESTGFEFVFPLWAITNGMPPDGSRVCEFVVPIESKTYGRCVLLYQHQTTAIKNPSRLPEESITQIPDTACLLVLLEKLKHAGDSYFGIDRNIETDEVRPVAFFEIDSVLRRLRFHFHVENS